MNLVIKACVLCVCFIFTSICSASEITLQWNWDRPIDPGIDGYRVYYSINKPGGLYDGSGVDQGDSGIEVPPLPHPPELTLTGLQGGVKYYFVVTAFTEGGLESDYSNEVASLDSAGWPLPPQGLRIKGE